MYRGNAETSQGKGGIEPNRMPQYIDAVDEGEQLVTRIVEAVASVRDADPMDLPPLHEEGVDVEALSTLFGGPDRSDLTVSLGLYDCQVVIESDRICVYETVGHEGVESASTGAAPSADD